MKQTVAVRSGRDRLRYVLLYEPMLVAILVPISALILERPVVDVGAVTLVLSLKAMLFGWIYNGLCDRLDARAGRVPHERSLPGRLLHAAGFECGLVMTSLPIVMWALDLSLAQALLMDAFATSIVVIYTFAFTWCYDRMFPVEQPEAARLRA